MDNHYKRELEFTYIMQLIKNAKFKILILFLVGALLGAGYSIVGRKGYVEVYQSTQTANEADYETATKDLGTSQIQTVEGTYESYKSLVKQRSDLMKYINTSVYFNTDSLNGKGHRIVYAINGGKKSDVIASSIETLLVNKALYDQVNPQLSKKLSFSVFSQLVNVSTDRDRSDKNVIIENSSDESKGTAVTLVVNIYGSTSNDMSILTKYVKQRLNSLVKQMKKMESSLSVNNMGEIEVSIVNSGINQNKTDIASQLSTISSSISALENTLSTAERTYFDYLCKTGGTKPKSVIVFSKVAFVKPIIAVAMILPILYLIVIIMKYMFGSKLHTAHEMEKIFNIKLLREEKENSTAKLNEELMNIIDNNKQNCIGIISSFYGNNGVKSLKDIFSQDVLQHVIIIDHLPETAEDFKKFNKISKMIIVEKVNESDISNIEKYTTYIKNKEKNIIGAFVIK